MALEYRSCYWPGLVAPVRPTLGVWFVMHCPSAAAGVCARAVSGATWRLLTGAHVLCVLCAVSVATWRLLTAVRALCGMRVMLMASLPPFAPFFCLLYAFFFLFLPFYKKRKCGKGAHKHYRHRHGQLEQRCSSALFPFVVRVACVFLAVTPRGCGSCVGIYTGAG